jgi:hypothetical protein
MTDPSFRLYLWRPKTTDVPADVEDPSTRELSYLLSHARSTTLRVFTGDTVESVLRTHFLVSPNVHPNAFRQYVGELVRRNRNLVLPPPGEARIGSLPDARSSGFARLALVAFQLQAAPRLRDLVEGEDLDLPSGPQFAGMSRPELGESHYRALTAEILGRRLGTPVTDDLLQPEARVELEQIARDRDDAVGRRILPAGPLVLGPAASGLEYQVVAYVERGTEDANHLDKNKVSRQYYASYLPVPAACTSACRTTTEMLGLTEPIVPASSAGLLLLADSGLDSSAFPGVKVLSLDGETPQAIQDIADNRHGTFIFGELAHGSGGPLPLDYLYVARVADGKCGPAATVKWCLDMVRLRNVCEQMQEAWYDRSSGNGMASTVVVNVSFAGGENGANGPFSEFGNFLFVVAAGNDGKRTLGDVQFARQNQAQALHGALLVVGALDETGNIADYSNTDAELVDVFARGSCVCGRGPQLNGTSQAAPVAALAARIVSDRFPKYPPGWVKWRLISTSEIISTGARANGGVIDLQRALESRPLLMRRATDPRWQAVAGVKMDAEEWGVSNGVGDYGVGRTLRLRQVPCKAGMSGQVCFTHWRLLAAKEPLTVPQTVTATITLVGGKSETMAAGAIRDLILPVDHRLSDVSVVADAHHGPRR